MAQVFDKMISDLAAKNGANMLEDCMAFNVKAINKIPTRYRLIAYGFVNKLSLNELNEKLLSEGCEKLYARNPMEAGLVFAFLNGLSYREWKKLNDQINNIFEDKEQGEGYFQSSSITYRQLVNYVKSNSENAGDLYYTKKYTELLKKKIEDTQGNEEKFREFMVQNQEDFSLVREKARYYFCKYLYYYIEQRIDMYLQAKQMGFGEEQAAVDLYVLKGATKLRKKTLTEDEVRKILYESSLSFGNIYDVFNYYYFDYVTTDWMEVLLDYYGNIELLSVKEKKKLADSLRAYRSEWKKMGDDEVLQMQIKEMEEKERQLDQEYALDGLGRGYQKNRSGEKAVRNYIKGTLDLDRTSLICYLLFFSSDLTEKKDQYIDQKRLNKILSECGYSELRDVDEFDCFIKEFLNAEDPTEYLMEAVTRYALEQKNFFLYHMYRDSSSTDKVTKKYMG